jgi:hypothetical protein
MSNPPVVTPPVVNEPAPRPVSLITIGFLFVLFVAFSLVVRYFYAPDDGAPHRAAAENLGEGLEWRATSATRRAALRELRETQTGQISGYGWVDQQAGVVHLPIERAMELTLQQYGAKP